MAFLQPDEYSMDFVSRNLTQGAVQTHFSENADAAYEHAIKNVSFGAHKWFENNNQLDLAEEQLARMRSHNTDLPSIRDLNRENGFNDTTELRDKFNNTVNELRTKEPNAEWLNYDELNSKARQKTIDEANLAEHEYKDISGRSSFGGAAGSMVGFLAGSMADPINLGVMVATAPIALESLPAAIFGNALMNTGTEAASQYIPGGQRDWARERGLTEEQIDTETKQAMLMAPVGGAVFGGLIHAGGKAVGAMVKRLSSDNPAAVRAAVDDLKGKDLGTEANDALEVISRTQQVEDYAALNGMLSRVTGFDQTVLQRNLHQLAQINEAMARGTSTDKINNAPIAYQALQTHIEMIDNVIRSFKEGRVEDIDAVIKLLPEDVQERINARTSEKQSRPLDVLTNAEQLLKDAESLKARVERDKAIDTEQLTKMRDVSAKLQKEADDARAIVDDLNAKKKALEQNIIDLHDGKYGDVQGQVSAIHNNFKEQLTAIQKDIDAFTPELNKATTALDDFSTKLDKAERRASRDVAARQNVIDTQTAKQLEDARANANGVNQSEYRAAIEAFQEQRIIEANKKAYVELLLLNPKTDPATIRRVLTISEMLERRKQGEYILDNDFLYALPQKEAEVLRGLLDKADTTEGAVSHWLAKQVNKIKQEGEANIAHIRDNIEGIMDSFEAGSKPIDVVNRIVEISETVRTEPVKLDAIETMDKHDNIINENINTEVAHPLTGELTNAKAIADEIDSIEWKADFIEQCSKGN